MLIFKQEQLLDNLYFLRAINDNFRSIIFTYPSRNFDGFSPVKIYRINVFLPEIIKHIIKNDNREICLIVPAKIEKRALMIGRLKALLPAQYVSGQYNSSLPQG